MAGRPPPPISEHAMTARTTRAKKEKKKPPRPSTADKIATVWSAEQNLKPWDVRPVKAPPPMSEHVLDTRRARTPQPEREPNLNKRYRLAKKAPVSRSARKRLADTMTAQRNLDYFDLLHPPPPHPASVPPWAGPKAGQDGGLIGALTGTARTFGGYGRGAGEGLGRWAGEAAQAFIPNVAVGAPGRGHVYGPTPEAREKGLEAIFGKSLVNLAAHGDTSHLGAAGVELLATFPPFKLLGAVTIAAKAGRIGGAAAAREAFGKAVKASLTTAKVDTRATDVLLSGPERDAAHAYIDEISANPEIADATKQMLDRHIYDSVTKRKSLKTPAARRDAASTEYGQLVDDAKTAGHPPEVPGAPTPQEISDIADELVQA